MRRPKERLGQEVWTVLLRNVHTTLRGRQSGLLRCYVSYDTSAERD